MPLSILIAVGTTAAESDDTVLADGAQATLALTGEGRALVEVKTSDGQYVRVAELNTKNAVQKVYGPAVFRVRRELVLPIWVPNGLQEVTVPCGVDVYTDAALVQGLTNTQLRSAPVPVAAAAAERDSTGELFEPGACTHTYGYNASGLIVTDNATSATGTWVKTYSYTAGNLTGETNWVKQ